MKRSRGPIDLNAANLKAAEQEREALSQAKAANTPKADCGVTFDHDRHLYLTEREKIKACDGSTTKRSSS